MPLAKELLFFNTLSSLSVKLPEDERAGNEIEILKKLAAIYLRVL